eukprot:3939113-Rhodomonas_salina.3
MRVMISSAAYMSAAYMAAAYMSAACMCGAFMCCLYVVLTCRAEQGKRDEAEPLIAESLELEAAKDAFHPDT